MTVPLLAAPVELRPRRSAAVMVPVFTVLFILGLLIAPSIFTHTQPTATGVDFLSAPDARHWFGTDQLGRDVLVRTVFGARPVLIASLLGVVLAMILGVSLGIASGIAPRWLNAVLMRIVDILLALPVLLIALILIATAGSGVPSIVLAIGIAFTPGFARIVESSVRRLRSAEYVEAARVFGSTSLHTAIRHLLPNLIRGGRTGQQCGRLGCADGHHAQLPRSRCPTATTRLGQRSGGRGHEPRHVVVAVHVPGSGHHPDDPAGQLHR